MKQKKYYTQIEVDEYVRKLMTDSESALSKQAERLEKEKQINKNLTKELEASKQKEKSTARLLTIAERKAKYIESTTRSKCAMEIERLARLSEKWEDFFAGLSEKYQALDKAKLDEFKEELTTVINQMVDMQSGFEEPVSPAEKAHLEEINRLGVVKEKKKSELDGRFDKLVLEFNMKIGDNATRGRGRPKKSEAEKLASKKAKASVYPPKGASGFDFEEALNPTDSLEDIMSDLMGKK